MKKPSQGYFKQIQTKPSRTQSPDFKSGNSIRPTRSPQNIQYILKQNDRTFTPTKNQNYETVIKAHQQPSTAPRYFESNRSNLNARSNIKNTRQSTYDRQLGNQEIQGFSSSKKKMSNNNQNLQSSFNHTINSNANNYCHQCCSGNCHCVHAVHNQQVVSQLKKIITMINGATVSQFEPTQSQNLKNQFQNLKQQNNKLNQLIYKLKSKQQIKYDQNNASDSQIKILKQQLNQKNTDFDRQRQQLYRTNKTLSSNIQSLQHKLQLNERQLQNLTNQLNIRDQRQPQQKQKMSISMIREQYKQQYNSLIKTIKSNVQYQVNNQLSDFQSQIKSYQAKLNQLQKKLKNIERVDQINRNLQGQNRKLKQQIQQLQNMKKSQKPVQKQIQASSYQPNPQLSRLQKNNQQLNEYITIISKQLTQTKISYQNQIADLQNKNTEIQEKIMKQTQAKVRKLMESYEHEIKILKKQTKLGVCNHKGIQQENQSLKQQSQSNWQEVIKLRNQLAKYTGNNSQLEAQIYNLKTEIARLNHQIDDDRLNLSAKTKLLDNQNSHLRQQINTLQININKLNHQIGDDKLNLSANTQLLENENIRLRQQIQNLQNKISKLNHQINDQKLNLSAKTSLLQNQNARLRKQLQNNQQLSRNISKLQIQNTRLKQEVDIRSSNVSSIHILQNQKQMYLAQIAQHKSRYQQLQQQNSNLFYQIDRLKNQHSRKQIQIRQNLKRQLDETSTMYQDQINKSHQQYLQLNNQYDKLSIQYNQLKLQLDNMKSNQPKFDQEQVNRKLHQYQMTIANLSGIIEETELKIGKLDESLRKKNQQNSNLSRNVELAKQDGQRKLRQCVLYWENQLRILTNKTDNQINTLKKSLNDKQQEEQNIITKMRSKISIFQTQSLKKQLYQLKKMVEQGRFQKIQDQLAKIAQNYQRQLIRSQQKTMQIDSLIKDKCALQEKLTNLQKLRLMLEQKTNILEGNVLIVENQLKQRKILCDSLLNQKVILEKQNLMLKKIRLDRQTIQATKAKARQISLKIDRILAIQQKRQQNLVEVSHVQNQVVYQSRTKKVQL